MDQAQKIIDKYIPNYSSLNDDDQRSIWNEQSKETIYAINSELLEVQGVGKHKLYHNEHHGNTEFHQYKNVLTYDVLWSAFQKNPDCESTNAALDKTPPFIKKAPKGYTPFLSGDWIRFKSDDVLHYGALYCASSYVQMLIWQDIDDWLDKRFPDEVTMEFLPADKHGMCEAKFHHTNKENFNKKMDARDSVTDYWTDTLKPEIITLFEKMTAAAYYIEDTDEEGYPWVSVILRNSSTMAIVRPEQLIEDVLKIKTNEAELKIIVAQYVKTIKSLITSNGY